MIDIKQSKTDYIIAVIHGECDHLCFRDVEYKIPRDDKLIVRWGMTATAKDSQRKGLVIENGSNLLPRCTIQDGLSDSGTPVAYPRRKQRVQPIVIVSPPENAAEPPMEVMMKHALLKRKNLEGEKKGKSKGLDRNCWVCYRGLNPFLLNVKHRSRTFMFCAGCNSEENIRGPCQNRAVSKDQPKYVHMHEACYFYHPSHRGFTRMFTEKDGCSSYEVEARDLREKLNDIPEVSVVGVRVLFRVTVSPNNILV